MVKDLPAYLDGEVRLFNFAEEGIDSHSLEWFFVIQEELFHEWTGNGRGLGFIHNQSQILEAFIKGRLYGLCMPETRMMYDNVTPDDPHFMTSLFTGMTQYRFPVFCAVDEENRIDFIWVAARMRRRGLGTRLVEFLKTQGVTGAGFVEGALPFWQTLGTVTHSTSHAQVVFSKGK